MIKSMIFASIGMIALASGTSVIAAKTAFQHELTLDCASSKSSSYANNKFVTFWSTRDLSLKTVVAKEDQDRAMAEIKAGKKSVPLTPAEIDALSAKAYASFDKALAECQVEKGWTDSEKALARKYEIAQSGLSRTTYHLMSPPDAVLFRRYKTLTPQQINDIRTAKIESSGLLDAIINDLKADAWYARTKIALDLTKPYPRKMVADAYMSKLLGDLAKAEFKKSAAARFPATDPDKKPEPPKYKDNPTLSILCPRDALTLTEMVSMNFGADDIALQTVNVTTSRTPTQVTEAVKIANEKLAGILNNCASDYGWSNKAKQIAEKYTLVSAGSSLLAVEFGKRGVMMSDMVKAVSLDGPKMQTIVQGKYKESGNLDIAITELKAKSYKLDFTDPRVRLNVEEAVTMRVYSLLLADAFSTSAKAGFKD